jgi:DmsE family decaheme c-type cytochrome
MRVHFRLALLLMVGGAVFMGTGQVNPEEPPGGEQTASPVEMCAKCHQHQANLFKSEPHSALDSKGLASMVGAPNSCAACHLDVGTVSTFRGGVSEAAKSQGCTATFAFGETVTPALKSQRCLACHKSDKPRYFASGHALSGMACTSCHDILCGESSGVMPLQKAVSYYRSSLQGEAPAATCGECHGDVLAQFELNERHRLEEGILDCTSCHDPHEPQTRVALGGFKQKECAKCHADKGSPHVFEHGSVFVEGCTACHQPHGSPNRHLLSFQSQGELCYSCHGVVPGFHSRFGPDEVCTNCHYAIHGSNLDPFFLK